MKALIVANWKMNPAMFAEAKKLLDASRKAAEQCANISLVVAPPAIYLRDLADGRRTSTVSFALQHGHAEARGAFTGETSMVSAKESGATHVIIGHAERRRMGETNEDTQKKVRASLALGLTPILCVGEEKRTPSGEHLEIVRAQVRAGLQGASSKLNKLVIAYEPVWAIGASAPMSPHDMHEMSIFIRKVAVDAVGQAGHRLKILYGGAVDETSVVSVLRDGDVRGLLIGRASLDANQFRALLRAADHL